MDPKGSKAMSLVVRLETAVEPWEHVSKNQRVRGIRSCGSETLRGEGRV